MLLPCTLIIYNEILYFINILFSSTEKWIFVSFCDIYYKVFMLANYKKMDKMKK